MTRKADKELVQVIVKSLNFDWPNWSFNECLATHTSGVSLWIANMPIFDLGIYTPTPKSFSLFDKLRIYRALDVCRSKVIMAKLQKIASKS